MDLSDDSEKIPSDTTGIDHGTFRLVAQQRLNHYATTGPTNIYVKKEYSIQMKYSSQTQYS